MLNRRVKHKPWDDGHRTDTQCFRCKAELKPEAMMKNKWLAFCENCLEVHDMVGLTPYYTDE